MKRTILIVDDEQVLRESLAGLMEDEGYDVLQAGNGREAMEIVVDRPVDVILSDVRMPEMDGEALLGHLRRTAPETPVIMMTAYGTVESAVAAMRAGARDYLLKPVKFDELLVKVERALEYRDLAQTERVIADQLAEESAFENIVSESPNMLRLFEQVRKLATVKSSVLVMGESGTGKELFAKAIHYNGITRSKPFVAVNCGAIPESLIESELFGHKRGAFTGAVKDRTGYFESAHGGTIFLDEISTLPKNVQSALLRVLEERTVVPVGETRPRPIDVRVIAASNQNLEQMVRAGEFREDLLYRLNVVTLELPPLRDRRMDIPLLVQHFIAKYTDEMNKHVTGITNGAMRAMLNHEWRGNVRELENVIERAVIFADGREIQADDLPFGSPVGGGPRNGAGGSGDSGGDSGGDAGGDAGDDLKEALRQYERQHIIHCLRRCGYDKTEAAKQLGIGMSSLYRKLDELEIPKNPDEPAFPAAR